MKCVLFSWMSDVCVCFFFVFFVLTICMFRTVCIFCLRFCVYLTRGEYHFHRGCCPHLRTVEQVRRSIDLEKKAVLLGQAIV